MAYDGLWDNLHQRRDGRADREDQRHAHISREEAGRVSPPVASAVLPRRTRTGCSTTEIATVEIPQRKGDPLSFREDEVVRGDTTAESLSKLKPAFAKTAPSPPFPPRRSPTVAASGRRDVARQGRRARCNCARRDRPSWRRRRARLDAAVAAVGPRSRRPPRVPVSAGWLRPLRDQRSVRIGGHPSMRDLGISSDRVNVNGWRHPRSGTRSGFHGARLAVAPRARVAASRRRHRCGVTVRRRWVRATR